MPIKQATSPRRRDSWFQNIPVHRKFMLFYLLMAAGLISFALFSNRVSTRAIVAQAEAQSNREILLIRESLDSYFSEAIAHINFLSIDPSIQSSLLDYDGLPAPRRRAVEKRVSELVSKYVATRPTFAEIVVFSEEGEVVYTGELGAHSADNLRALAAAGAEGRQVPPQFAGLHPFVAGSGRQVPAVPLVKPVIHLESGRRIGTVVLLLTEEQIATKYTTRNDYVELVSLVDREGEIVSSTAKERLFTPYGAGGEALPGPVATTGREAGQIVSAADIPQTGWRIITNVPIVSVTRESAALTRLLVLFVVACLAAGFAGNYVAAQTISRPIRRLAGVMTRFQREGDTSLRVEVRGEDEIAKLGGVFNATMGRIGELMQQNRRQQDFLRDYQFRLVQSQLNPHFLYNALEIIVMFVQMDMKEQAVDACKKLSVFYRLSLSYGSEIISVADEMRLTDSYLAVQSYRYVEYVRYTMHTEPGLEGCRVPKLTLQPLVENAIYHGLKPRGGGGELRIDCRRDGEDLLFTVEDNGVGMPREQIDALLAGSAFQNPRQSFGIVGVNTKLKLLYGAAYGLAIASEPGQGTRVTVRIPLGHADTGEG